MKNITKWNKELFYGITFFVSAIMWSFLNPVGIVRDLIDLSPNALDIRYQLIDWGVDPIFYHILDISMIGLLFFLLCSIYVGCLSLRKASPSGERGISSFIPKNAPGFLAVSLIFVSLFYIILNTLIVLNLWD